MATYKIGENKIGKITINGFTSAIEVTIIDLNGLRCNVVPIDSSILEDMSWVEMEQAFTNLPLSVFK
tara:strand:- start:2172 stop:2372 length:201 start_codon:yes stop_codon:yes gene_type:complete